MATLNRANLRLNALVQARAKTLLTNIPASLIFNKTVNWMIHYFDLPKDSARPSNYFCFTFAVTLAFYYHENAVATNQGLGQRSETSNQ